MDRGKTRLYQASDLLRGRPEERKTLLYHQPAPARASGTASPATRAPSSRTPEAEALRARDARLPPQLSLRETKLLPIEQLLQDPHVLASRRPNRDLKRPASPARSGSPAHQRVFPNGIDMLRGRAREVRLVLAAVLLLGSGAMCLAEGTPPAPSRTSARGDGPPTPEEPATPAVATPDETARPPRAERRGTRPRPREEAANAAARTGSAAETGKKPEPAMPQRADTRMVASERRAVDALAAGDLARAAETYATLARRAPENATYAEAARILRARLAQPTP